MSQFIEMFENKGYDTKELRTLILKSFPGEWGVDNKDGSGVKVIRTTNITNEDKLDLSEVVIRSIAQPKLGKKKLVKGDILLERSGGTKDYPVGRVAYFESQGIYVVNNFTQTLRCINGVESKYVFYFLFFYYKLNKMQVRSMGNQTTGIQNLNMDDYMQISVIVPPIETQKQFLHIVKQADKSKFIGFKSQFIEMFGNPLASVQKYPIRSLFDCCEINPRRPLLNILDSDLVSFVPMASVNENGFLQDLVDEEYGKIKKGFTYFENNDVLFAKITPCMENGKGAIAHSLTNGIGMGSTEFHVLRPIKNISNPYWLLCLTRMPIFRDMAAKNMSGTGGQKRVGSEYMSNFKVGLPPIDLQIKFAELYKQADKSKYIN